MSDRNVPYQGVLQRKPYHLRKFLQNEAAIPIKELEDWGAAASKVFYSKCRRVIRKILFLQRELKVNE